MARRPQDDWIGWLPDEIQLAADAGQPIVLHVSQEPPAHVRRLMAALGVPVEVKVPAHELTRTHDCKQPHCTSEAERGSHFCAAHHPAADQRENGRAFLAADYRDVDADGRYGCKITGCPGRAGRNRGAAAYLCDEHAEAKKASNRVLVREGIAASKATQKREPKEPAAATAEAREPTVIEPSTPPGPSSPVASPRPAVGAAEPGSRPPLLIDELLAARPKLRAELDELHTVIAALYAKAETLEHVLAALEKGDAALAEITADGQTA